jgi:ribosomal protein L2
MIQPQQTSQDHRPDTVASSSQHFDALASLINIAAQHGSDKTASITTENHSSTGTNGASVVRPQDQTIAGLTTVIANGEGDTPVSQSIATITYPDGTLTSIIPVDGMSSLPAQAIQAERQMKLRTALVRLFLQPV